MPSLSFDLSLPEGIVFRSAYLTDLGRRPLATRTRQGRWLQLETSSPGPYMLRATLGSALGDLDVVVDAAGEGYLPGSSAPNLLVEAIHSRLARCERRLQGAKLAEGNFADLARAREAYAQGDFISAFTSSICAGDEIEYAASRKALATNGRKAMFSGAITFGERLGQWSIGVGPDWPENTRPPEFTRPLAQREALLPACEAMTLPNFWRWIEPQRWKYRWDVLDEMIEWAVQKKLAVKSFAIFWMGIGGTPVWFRDLTYREQLLAIEQMDTRAGGPLQGSRHRVGNGE